MTFDGRYWLLALAMLTSAASTGARGASVVYSNDFENTADKEWSVVTINATPQVGRRYLGPFTKERVTLHLEKLPAHKFVRVSVELYLLGMWAGNGASPPKAWQMGIDNGATLVDATFSNYEAALAGAEELGPGRGTQSYPSLLPGEGYPAGTGAAERNTLGYQIATADGSGATRMLDAVYRLSFVIPHEGADATIYFGRAGSKSPPAAGAGAEPAEVEEEGEEWGLDNVRVEALDDTDVPKLDDAQIRRLLEAVGGRDPAEEAAAFWRLAAGGEPVAKFVRERVKPPVADRPRFAKALAKLGGDDFAAREHATAELTDMGPAIEPLLRAAIDNADSAELRLRLEAVAKELRGTPPADPEARRYAIAMKLLGVIERK